MIFQIFQLKWKISKHFTSPEQQSGWRKLFSPHQIKASYVSGSKMFERRFTGLYRHLLSKCTKTEVLEHLEMVQCKCFFWHLAPIRNMFLAVLQEYIFFIMLSELRFVKWVRFFERNCNVKWMIFFASFCCIWDFLPKILNLVDKL